MLGGAFAAFTVSAGVMHSYAVFLVAFIEQFRWSRAETSIAYCRSWSPAGVRHWSVRWSTGSGRAVCS